MIGTMICLTTSILFAIGLLCFVFTLFGDEEHTFIISLMSAMAGAFFILSIAIIQDITITSPSAIDVYQGKTTLQITYRDSIAVDSVVVYKPQFKK